MNIFPWWNSEFSVFFNVFADVMVVIGAFMVVSFSVGIIRQIYLKIRQVLTN